MRHIRYCTGCVMPETSPICYRSKASAARCANYERRQASGITQPVQYLMCLIPRVRSLAPHGSLPARIAITATSRNPPPFQTCSRSTPSARSPHAGRDRSAGFVADEDVEVDACSPSAPNA